MTLIIDFFRNVDSLKQYTRFQVMSKHSILLLRKCHFHILAKKKIRIDNTMNMIFQRFIITYILYSDVGIIQGFKFGLCKRYSRDYQTYLSVYGLFFK